jgi:hypothetical protein
MLSYLHSLVLLSARRALGESLQSHSSPTEPFSDTARGPRGDDTGDLIDALVEGRVVMEKIRPLETRMRYQIDKLVRMAQEAPTKSGDAEDGQFFLIFLPACDLYIDRSSRISTQSAGTHGRWIRRRTRSFWRLRSSRRPSRRYLPPAKARADAIYGGFWTEREEGAPTTRPGCAFQSCLSRSDETSC